MRGLTALLALVVLSGCLTGIPASDDTATVSPTADSTAESSLPEEGGVSVTVTEVVDGDTIKIAYANGSRDSVRLLGVDTPEVHVENTPDEFEGVPDTDVGRQCLRQAGEAASTYAKERLAGETVTLRFDERADRRGYYGRLLGYVIVNGTSFNRALLRMGHARVYDSTFTERERYEATASDARAAHRGLWSCADPGAGTDTETEASSQTATPIADGGTGLFRVATVHADASGNDNENLHDEYVVVRNAGDVPLDVSGWTVSDVAGHTYTIPDGTVLDSGAELTLRTGSGTNTETTLYWNAGSAIWNNGGDEVIVRNASGAVVVRRSY
ncbi:MAG: lamin tail domain-containing protein [Halobellus sp.]|uniref:lamin tail domain-containing protein n=1 Tax=Halobellus sp. TaxID=1979212 RepID=UPI0035D46FE2